MAIQVTGLFKNPKTGQLFQSPKLELVPHLTYRGEMSMDVNITSDYAGAIPYDKIDRTLLSYNPDILDPYDQLIDALETYVINDLSTSNPDCIFTRDSTSDDFIIDEPEIL